MHLERTRRLAHLDVAWVHVSRKCLVAQSASCNPSHEKLLTDPVAIKLAGKIVFKRV